MEENIYCPECEQEMELFDEYRFGSTKYRNFIVHVWKCPDCGTTWSDEPDFD